MPRYLVMLVAAALLVSTGCDSDRIANLEKQNKELQTELSKSRNAVAEYDLQSKCSKDARGWFSENWNRDKDSILLDYTNHYNKGLNKCFIVVEYHYRFMTADSWMNHMSLWDVSENSKYGEFSESHVVLQKPDFKIEDKVVECEVAGKKCTDLQGFNQIARAYMND